LDVFTQWHDELFHPRFCGCDEKLTALPAIPKANSVAVKVHGRNR
jgi:hypothetical protein